MPSIFDGVKFSVVRVWWQYCSRTVYQESSNTRQTREGRRCNMALGDTISHVWKLRRITALDGARAAAKQSSAKQILLIIFNAVGAANKIHLRLWL